MKSSEHQSVFIVFVSPTHNSKLITLIMKFSATITKVLPPRTISNEKGDFKFQPIEVEILEDCKRFDNTTFVREHNIKVDLVGKFAENFKLNPGTEITIDLVFEPAWDQSMLSDEARVTLGYDLDF